MIGTIVNTGCIILGSVVGSLLKKGLGSKYQDSLYTAMGISAAALGLSTFCGNIAKSTFPVLFIISLALGGLAGTAMDLDGRTKKLIARYGGDNLAGGLISACLLFCVGTFSIVGPILSATKGDNTFLYTNATLDLVTSMVFAATYGIGIIVSAVILFCWQGMFYLIGRFASGPMVMESGLIEEIAITGGLLIVASGLGLLKIKDCKTLNYLPALLVPVIWFLAKRLFFI